MSSFDPQALHAGRPSFQPALRLCTGLALLDDGEPSRWRGCRSAALRYLEALGADGVRHRDALLLLRRAVATWTPEEVGPSVRKKLADSVPVWAGTAYRLRWRTEPEPVVAPRAPAPGQWAEMRAWRAALAAERNGLRARREQWRDTATAIRARSGELLQATGRRVAESRATSDASLSYPETWGGAGEAATLPWQTRPAQAPARDVRDHDAARRPSDDEIVAIARRIRRAVGEPRPDDPQEDILSCLHELSPEDESRVEAVLEAFDRETHDRSDGPRCSGDERATQDRSDREPLD